MVSFHAGTRTYFHLVGTPLRSSQDPDMKKKVLRHLSPGVFVIQARMRFWYLVERGEILHVLTVVPSDSTCFSKRIVSFKHCPFQFQSILQLTRRSSERNIKSTLQVTRKIQSVASRASCKLGEEVKSVASRASYNLQEVQSVTSRASYKLQEK